MSRLTRSLILIGVSLWLLSGSVFAQDSEVWKGSGAAVAFVTHLAIDPDEPEFLFAFISNSVLRNPDQTQTAQGQPSSSWAPYFSVDGGDHWQPASNDLAGFHPTIVKIFPERNGSVIWVGTEKHGLWRSDNGGRTWRPALIPQLVDQQVMGLTRDARGRLHLMTQDASRYPSAHLYTSDDGGYNWRHRMLQRYTDAANSLVNDLIADPFDSNRLYVTTAQGLLITENAGFNWRKVNLPLPVGAHVAGKITLAADPTQRGRIYVVLRAQLPEGRHQLMSFISLNSGRTWRQQHAQFSPIAGFNPDAEPTPTRLLVDPLARQRLLLATDSGLWLSSDGGESWRSGGTTLSGVSLQTIAVHPRRKGNWMVAGAGGLWRTRSAGSHWEMTTQGLPPASSIHQLLSLSTDGKTLLALNGGFLPEDSMTHPLWRSEDAGQTWEPARRGLEGVHLRRLIAYPHDPDVVFALTDNGFARTDNGGLSWFHRKLRTYPLALITDPKRENVYLATARGLQRSTNKGDSWTSIFDKSGVLAATVDASGALFLVAYGDNGVLELWRSQDAGNRWRRVGLLPVTGAVRLFSHPHQPDLLALVAPWEGLLVSIDGGINWSRRDTGIPMATRWRGGSPEIPNAPNLLAFFMDPESGLWWASRDGGGVFRSLNNGALWEDATGDLGDALIFTFTRGPDGVMAGTSNLGVIQRQKERTPATPPEEVDVRIEIFWPHDFAPVTAASQANLGLRLYQDHSLEPPPCAWSPNVDVWVAQDAEPLRRIDLAEHRTVEGHPFPFWVMNDLDVTWANNPEHKLIYLAKVAPGLAQSYGSVWIHAADSRTFLPEPPQPTGVAAPGVNDVDGRILIVWPHDEAGRNVPPDEANLVNITAALFKRDTLLALSSDDLPDRVWLIGALDNQIGRRLAVGRQRLVEIDGLRYTLYDFNDIDVSLARDPMHHWSFWLESPTLDIASNIWVHGSDARTIAPLMVEPIVGCQP